MIYHYQLTPEQSALYEEGSEEVSRMLDDIFEELWRRNAHGLVPVILDTGEFVFDLFLS